MLGLVKTLVGALFMPLPFAAGLLMAALVLHWRGRRRWALGLAVAALLIGFGSALAPVGDSLLGALESRHPAASAEEIARVTPRYIVVLGSGYRPASDRPVTGALDAAGLARIVEGVRLYHSLPGMTLVVSGGAANPERAPALGYAILARALGVPEASVFVLDGPRDTAAELRTLHERYGAEPLLLVTSASHLPRAMAHGARLDMHLLPMPTGHLVDADTRWGLRSLLPSGVHLRKTETAVHELLGSMALWAGLVN